MGLARLTLNMAAYLTFTRSPRGCTGPRWRVRRHHHVGEPATFDDGSRGNDACWQHCQVFCAVWERSVSVSSCKKAVWGTMILEAC